MLRANTPSEHATNCQQIAYKSPTEFQSQTGQLFEIFEQFDPQANSPSLLEGSDLAKHYRLTSPVAAPRISTVPMQIVLALLPSL